MYTTISGIYENGRVILQESAPTQNRAKVLVVFVEESQPVEPIQPSKTHLTQHFSERWQGQFALNTRSDDARLDYLKQRYNL